MIKYLIKYLESKFENLFKTKNSYHDFVLKQYFYLKGPKVKNEVKNLSKYFNVKTFSPFL